MITIYHNPRCTKSRETLAILQAQKADIQVVPYLREPISEEKLREIITLLGIDPIELIRKNETIWKDNYKGREMNAEEVIEAILEHPKLMERPIVINGDKATIGRPPVKVLEIL